MAQACNPSTLGGWGGWITRSRDQDHPGQHGETLSLLKIQKISWAWWHVPVISATQEAEAGELPEPRRQRLRWAEIAPLHPSLGNKSETLSQKKKSQNYSWFCGLKHGCCVSKQENNTNLLVYLHQSSWVIRYIVNEQLYHQRNFILSSRSQQWA